MAEPFDPASDPFKPPAIPTLVSCLHCGQEYESYLIEWRVEADADGRSHGFWCCPVPGCGGCGFGFDLLPVDPDYRDESGGWVGSDDDDEGEDDPLDDDAFDDEDVDTELDGIFGDDVFGDDPEGDDPLSGRK